MTDPGPTRRPSDAPSPGPDGSGPILVRLFVPLAVMLALLIGAAFAALAYQYRARIEEARQSDVAHSIRNFDQLVRENTRAMAGIIEALSIQPGLGEAVAADDRGRLLAATRDLLERLGREQRITHLYFHRLDRVNLLRVHHPDEYGDRIDRHTLLEAERTGKLASGIEPGPLGPFTLRVVKPLVRGTQRVGYIELGMEIEDILRSLHKMGSTEVLITLKKRAANRHSWETAMRRYGHRPDWEQFADDVLIFSSRPSLPDEIRPLIATPPSGSGRAGDVAFGGRYWTVSILPVPYASGRDFGRLILFHDNTEARAVYHQLLGRLAVGFLIVLSVLSAFVLTMLRRSDRTLLAQQASLREYSRLYEHLAHHDRLTGLPNRYSLEQRLEQALRQARRGNTGLALAFIDLDHFKTINDTLGHEAGDNLLIGAARRLEACVRESDIAARLGGDEFVVVLTGIGAGPHVEHALAKIQAALAKPYEIGGNLLYATPSIGVALFPADGGTPAALMKSADSAMYRAKEEGRNKLRYFAETVRDQASAGA